jgi:hypothetical protein
MRTGVADGGDDGKAERGFEQRFSNSPGVPRLYTCFRAVRWRRARGSPPVPLRVGSTQGSTDTRFHTRAASAIGTPTGIGLFYFTLWEMRGISVWPARSDPGHGAV